MGNRRRKDKHHDVGDSMPGTVGDSNGAIHDEQGGPTFDPDDAVVPESSSNHTNQQEKDKLDQQEDNETSESGKESSESQKETTRMRYAKKFGDSWPENRKHRFLKEHDKSAEEMGWKLKE